MYKLKPSDYEIISRQNEKAVWVMSLSELLKLIDHHEKARQKGNERRMAMLEERLEDINYHEECGLIAEGKYEEARAAAKRND